MNVTAEGYIFKNISAHLQANTGGSIQRTSLSVTEAFTIPALDLTWNSRIVYFTCASLEDTAINEALGVVL